MKLDGVAKVDVNLEKKTATVFTKDKEATIDEAAAKEALKEYDQYQVVGFHEEKTT